MERRRFLCGAGATLIALSQHGFAQQPRRTSVVGMLALAGADSFAQLRDAMRDLGYVEGRNVVFERRPAGGNPALLPGLAAELVRLNVDVLYATGPAAVRAARDATSTIPIVAFDLETDPVGAGLVRSLNRPGGNLTGLFLDLPDLAGKWLELLREAAPKRRVVGVLWDATSGTAQVAAARSAAQRFDLQLEVIELRGADDLDRALARAPDARVQALVVLSSPLTSGHSRRIAEFALTRKLPAISPFRAFADAGGLLSYGPDLVAFRRFSAAYVDRILNGADPAVLPIQQPTTFQFVVNARTARTLGIAVPQSLLLRADEVIR
jgi:putative tryptophan/tyrosine transport system substrate-binding protein